MSTRAQIIIKDEYDELWFYRHSDGYPEGVKPTLDQFCEWVNKGLIRANVEQSAGWLILLGAKEYGRVYKGEGKYKKKTVVELFTPSGEAISSGWKVGAYEPCAPAIHGDTAHMYVIALTDGPKGAKASWKEVKFDADKNTHE